MPIFIVGMPRSGTTLLSMIINAHSQVAIPPETHYFTKYWRFCRDRRCLENRARYLEFVDRLLSSPEFGDMGLQPVEEKQIEVRLSDLSSPDHTEVLSNIMENYASSKDAIRWGEKTPGHLSYIPTIASLFPTASFVCLTRDPRAIARSWQHMPGDRGNSFNTAMRWSWYASLIRRYSKQAYRILEILYEDLVDSPESIIMDVCRFLDLSFEPGMVSYHQDPDPTFNPVREPWKRMSLQPIDPGLKDRWKGELPQADVFLVDTLCRRGMTSRDYPGSHIRLNPALLLKVIGIILRGFLHEARVFIRNPLYRMRRLASTKSHEKSGRV